MPTATLFSMADEYLRPGDGSPPLTGHAAVNRAMWNADAPNWVEMGRANWEAPAPHWGAWHIPEEELGILPDLAGLDVIDLGCGTGYWCAWMKRMGASPVGVDLSEAQLETARSLQREHGLDFPLVHASAEDVPLPGGTFHLAFSEFGAATWCDPYLWIPEAYRLLRPGGRLIFLSESVLIALCFPTSEEPAEETLVRPQRGLHRMEWPADEGTDFCLPHGEMIALLRRTGFEVEALHELYAPDGAEDEVRFYTRRGWARRWPAEEVWVVRRTPD